MNITYLLGAGASYNAIPIIGQLDAAFKLVGEECKKLHFSSADLINAQTSFVSVMEEAYKQSRVYGTIDTYAKKLSLNNDKKLSVLKNGLGLFFSIWQHIDNINPYLGSDFLKNRPNGFNKIDSRYFGLLSNYLETDGNNIKLPDNIKFLTWNYDVQLELTLKTITDASNLQSIINRFAFPNSITSQELPSIVHLNGIAGVYQGPQTIDMLHDRCSKNSLLDLFSEWGFIMKPRTTSHDKYLTYAWENDPVSARALQYADQIIKSTDILVVIGYSFPTFNDKIDKRLMQVFNENKRLRKVYIQNPELDKTLLARRFGLNVDNVIQTTDVKQFVLPLEYMNITPTSASIDVKKAFYGHGISFVDVTEQFRKLVDEGQLQGMVNHFTIKIQDPVPGVQKELILEYLIDGVKRDKNYKEGEMYLLN